MPILVVMGVMILSGYLYDFSRRLENRSLHWFLSHSGALLLFLSLWLGALFSNTLAFFKGASFGERMVVCLVPPVVWAAQVLYGFVGLFSSGEIFFLLFHHFILGCVMVALLGMALSDIGCRWINRRRNQEPDYPVFVYGNTILLVVSFILVSVMLWNGGHSYYYWYMEIYAKIFL